MKINRKETDVIYAIIPEEGVDFGDNFDHDCGLMLEDEEGNKIAIEYISLNEFAEYMKESYSEDDLADYIESKIKKECNPKGIEGLIFDSELLNWFERFRFSASNKSYTLTDNF